VSGALLVLYDADCGICTHSARLLRRLDRGHRLDLAPLQVATRLADAPPPAVLGEALHVRDAAGRWAVGGAALVRIGRALPLLRPFALVAGLPGIRRLVEPAYRLVARNRHRISRGLGLTACRVDRDRVEHRRVDAARATPNRHVRAMAAAMLIPGRQGCRKHPRLRSRRP